MADLFTHGAIPYLLGARSLSGSSLFWFVTGGLLPDLGARIPGPLLLLLERLLPSVELGEGDRWVLGFELLHAPVGLLLLCPLLGFCLPTRMLGIARASVSGWLLLGAAIHLVLDAFQRHPTPLYAWLYPFSTAGWEIGIVSTEASFWLWPILVPWVIWEQKRRTARA